MLVLIISLKIFRDICLYRFNYIYTTKESVLDSNLTLSDDSVEETSINAMDIKLRLHCEVGEVLLTLDSLSKLSVGDVLPIRKWDGKARLTLDGKIIAEVALVEVDGMIAMKVLSK